MATYRESKGPTPGGGVRSRINFRDDKGNPVDEGKATQVEILEYDKDNKVVGRTYGTIGGSGEELKSLLG